MKEILVFLALASMWGVALSAANCNPWVAQCCSPPNTLQCTSTQTPLSLGPTVADRFGQGVAAGINIALVGNYFENTNRGNAYYFQYSPLFGGSWGGGTPLPNSPVQNSDFGYAVAISSDGKTAVVGAPSLSQHLIPGAVYVFQYTTSWSLVATLVESTSSPSSLTEFGASVDVTVFWSGLVVVSELKANSIFQKFFEFQIEYRSPSKDDGNTVIVGAPMGGSSGQAYVFVKGAGWPGIIPKGPDYTLTPGSTGSYKFGVSVAINSLSGTTAVVGAPLYFPAGAAFVFTFNGVSWSQQVHLSSSTAYLCGQGVGISSDGTVIVAGDPGYSSSKGCVNVYNVGLGWSLHSINTPDAVLTASNGANGDTLGYSVAISSDRLKIVAGAPGRVVNSYSAQGSTYVFTTSASWSSPSTESFLLIATYSQYNAEGNSNMGKCVAITPDANFIISGVPAHNSIEGGVLINQLPSSCTSTLCVDNDPCNGVETCNIITPSTVACNSGVPLSCPDNGNLCDGTEYCQVNVGCSHQNPLSCPNNGNPCDGGEYCDPSTGCAHGIPPPPICDDGNPCNGVETCVNPGGCVAGTPYQCATGAVCTGNLDCQTKYCSALTNKCAVVTPPVPASVQVTNTNPAINQPVSVIFTLSDSGGESSSITIQWGDGTFSTFAGPYAPSQSYTLGSHSYSSSGTYCIKVCADDGTGTNPTVCDASFFASISCPGKKRASGGSGVSILVGNPAGGDPYFMGYDGKMFEMKGFPSEVYNLIYSKSQVLLNVMFAEGFTSDLHLLMGVVMRTIGLIINNVQILFSVTLEGNVILEIDGVPYSTNFNTTIRDVGILFESNLHLPRKTLHMSEHKVHHRLTVKTSQMAIQMMGVSYQPSSWDAIPNAPVFQFVDLEANILNTTFCPDGIWGRTSCGGHYDPSLNLGYRIHGNQILSDEFDNRID